MFFGLKSQKFIACSIVLRFSITERLVPQAWEEVRKFEDDFKDDLEEDVREQLKSILDLCSDFKSGNNLLSLILCLVEN